MTKEKVQHTLDCLAVEYIPAGVHKYLHVDNRRAWINLMTTLINKDGLYAKPVVLYKCAINWERLITNKISLLN